MIAASIDDYRRAAKRALPRFLFDYIDGGSGDELTLARNRTDLADVALRQRVLRDVSQIDLSARLFGKSYALPIALAPVGLAGMYARRGEVQAARAAKAAGVPFCLSTVSVCSLDEVTKGVGAAPWFQLYVLRDRGFMRELLARAAAAGSEALVFTVDMPAPGARRRDAASGLTGPAGPAKRMLQAMLHPAWAMDVGVMGRPHLLGNLTPILKGATGLSDFMAWIAANFDPTVTWSDLDWIRTAWRGPILLKGVLDPEDAAAALDLGVDGLIVSNHGGRQLDGALSTARALPAVVERVGGRIPVLADGGVRSGGDVARLLALGADMALIGRAWAYALAADGEAGVRGALALIERDLRTTMTLAGAACVSHLRDALVTPR